MVSITLSYSDLAMFTDPLGTRVAIPHLFAHGRRYEQEKTLVKFDGPDPVEYRGEGQGRSYDLVARFFQKEQDRMRDFLELILRAHTAPDSRLQLRTHVYLSAGLNPFEVVSISNLSEEHVDAHHWDVKFTATTVAYDLAER